MLEPLYDSYAAMARRAGGKIVPVSLQPPNWTIPHDQLAAAFGPKTKAILVNSPHNPTGTAFSKADLEAVAELCKKHDVIAICDEVYEHLIYEGMSPDMLLLPCTRAPAALSPFTWDAEV